MHVFYLKWTLLSLIFMVILWSAEYLTTDTFLLSSDETIFPATGCWQKNSPLRIRSQKRSTVGKVKILILYKKNLNEYQFGYTPVIE